MGIDKVVISQIKKVAKDSGKLDNAIDKIKDTVINKGLELVEESGIDSSRLPVNIPQYLRGESPSIPSPGELSNPENVCAMPALTSQQVENVARLVNKAQLEIEKIYETTNSIKSTLTGIKTPINTLQGSVAGLERVVDTVSTAVTAIKLIPIPTAVPPGIGIPINVITIFADTLDSIGKLLDLAKSNLKIIPQATELMTGIINNTIQKLNQVEQVIDPFLQTLTFIKATAELRPNCPNVTQEDINDVQDELLGNIQGSLAVAQSFSNPFAVSDSELEQELNESSDPGITYKNFKFVLEYEPDNPYFFPSRRIRCTRRNSTGYEDGISGGGSIVIYNINSTTNPSLEEGAYSYSSNLRVLVEEAEFAVDTYTDDIIIWKSRQIRDNVSSSAGTFVDTDDQEYLDQYEEIYGFLPSETNQPLPDYIRYGGTIVNLNSSPTDVEFGADRLVEGAYYGSEISGGPLPITSYIQSGIIQVNSPISIRMKTFGGTGDPTNSYTTGYTEALLTIKRSFSIQDDIDPFTGRVAGFDQSKIDDFVAEWGPNAITILDSVYETMMDVTTEFVGRDFATSLVKLETGTFMERLEIIYSGLEENTFLRNNVIKKLYAKAKPLLYNEPLLWLSQRLYGNVNDLRTNAFINVASNYYSQYNTNAGSGLGTVGYINQVYFDRANWWWTARKNAYGEDVGTGDDIKDKAATLGMLYLAFQQFLSTYTDLYGNRTDYNNGAWVGAASTLPIIPTQVNGDNDDIVISLQETQLADRNQTINEIVGSLDLIGTYTYDLEIIDSLPAVGGPDFQYPTNFTQIFIETT